MLQRSGAAGGGGDAEMPRFEHAPQQQQRGFLIVGNQRLHAAQLLQIVAAGAWVADTEMRAETEGAALARLAADADLAAHQTYQMLADRQPEAGAAKLAGDRGIGLGERLEQPGGSFALDADAAVAYRELQRYAVAVLLQQLHLQQDLAVVGEFHRVAEQIVQHLLQPQRVADQPARRLRVDFDEQLQPLFLDAADEQVAGVAQRFFQRKLGLLQLHAPGLDLGIIENIVEQAEQGGGRGLHFFQIVALAVAEPGFQHQMRQPHDGVHRRADFMAHVGEECAFGTRCSLGSILGFAQLAGAGGHHLFQILVHRGQLVQRRRQMTAAVVECPDQRAELVALRVCDRFGRRIAGPEAPAVNDCGNPRQRGGQMEAHGPGKNQPQCGGDDHRVQQHRQRAELDASPDHFARGKQLQRADQFRPAVAGGEYQRHAPLLHRLQQAIVGYRRQFRDAAGAFQRGTGAIDDAYPGDDFVLPQPVRNRLHLLAVEFPHCIGHTRCQHARQRRQIGCNRTADAEILDGELDCRQAQRQQQIPGKHGFEQAPGQRFGGEHRDPRRGCAPVPADAGKERTAQNLVIACPANQYGCGLPSLVQSRVQGDPYCLGKALSGRVF